MTCNFELENRFTVFRVRFPAASCVCSTFLRLKSLASHCSLITGIMDKRVRVTQACDACRASKLKCSGRNPCDVCEKRGEECTFAGSGLQIAPRKRGPPPGLVRSLREENAALKARVAALESSARVPPPAQTGSGTDLSLRASGDSPALHKRPDAGVLAFCDSTVMYYPPPLTEKVSTIILRLFEIVPWAGFTPTSAHHPSQLRDSVLATSQS